MEMRSSCRWPGLSVKEAGETLTSNPVSPVTETA